MCLKLTAQPIDEAIDRMTNGRPRPIDINLAACKLPLVRGCIVFGYPVSTLRAQARRGYLEIVRIDGQDYVTEAAMRGRHSPCTLEPVRNASNWPVA